MRRFVLLLLFVGTATVLAAGIAFAVTKECAGECSGTPFDDRLLGSDGVDMIHALDGNDKVFGREHDDWLKGGPGNDEVHGQSGHDRVKGHEGEDIVFGGAGDDLVRGGTAKQTDDGKRDILDCGPGNDTVYYTPREDEITDCEIKNP